MCDENPEVEAGLLLCLLMPSRNGKPDVPTHGVSRGGAGGILVKERIVEGHSQVGPFRNPRRVRRHLPWRWQARLERFRTDRKPEDGLRGNRQVEQVVDHARVSRMIVTGPWFCMSTTIMARNWPVSTGK